MRYAHIWLLAAGLAGTAFTATAPAAEAAAAGAEAAQLFELRPFTAHYTFTWHGMQAGTAMFRLRQLGASEWLYESSTEPRGIFKLVPAARAHVTSRMSVGPDGVRPLHFEGTAGNNSVPDAVLDFDWAAMRVRGHMQDDAVDMALKPGVQDDLSVMVSLLHKLGQGAPPAGMSLFDKNGIRDYAYTHVGPAKLATAIGELPTEVYRSQRAGSPRHNVYWCGTQYGDVPVRAEQRRGEDVEWRMELISIEREAGP